ncbi:hypothetical protein [Streptosporangium canum]|uniref:hypothetical protein n=1 Tax=Streptosporangium canum TaxID=324952 RepID=UPI0037B73C07
MISDTPEKTIAFVSLPYASGHPSEDERILGPLMAGIQQLGHRPLVLAAGPTRADVDDEPGLVRLRSVQPPAAPTARQLRSALADSAAVVREVTELLTCRQVDIVCWVGAEWGLGYLGLAPAGARAILLSHQAPDASSEHWRQAVQYAGAVCLASPCLRRTAAQDGWDTTGWRTLPLAVVPEGKPAVPADRQRLRVDGPIRIIAPREPADVLAELLRAIPPNCTRPIEVALPVCDFDDPLRRRADVIAACEAVPGVRPGQIRIQPRLPWDAAESFLSQAAVTVIPAREPLPSRRVAALALAAGTPVVAYDHGDFPAVIRQAGRTVQLHEGAAGLWSAVDDLLTIPSMYASAAAAALRQAARNTPLRAAAALLAASASTAPRRWPVAADHAPLP